MHRSSSPFLLLLVWHAPLGVCSAKHRHQSPEWTILSHIHCLIQRQVARFQVLLDSLHPCSTRTSWWSPPVLKRWSCYDILGICLVRNSCRNVAEHGKTASLDNSRQVRYGCPVVRLTSSFCTWWYHLIPNSFRKHHWSRASILSTYLTQHSEPYRKIGRMHVLYNCSLVEMAILDFLICLSGFCIADSDSYIYKTKL